jgi:hypothetical protein
VAILCVGGAWATDMLGDSSCSGSRPILSSQLSLGMEYVVTSSCIGDPDCRANDLKRCRWPPKKTPRKTVQK